ncbi:hypothetical protein IW492_06155 [Enterococcus sp. BWB1-3]|uniref:hypothetical protein n=1 Tax=Enterococcus sp. BWB1-3 TaxID=2787713 RepID=UPI001923A139|nr:hypothetical protein [Enterococcus sp. BWB1-3]MBL1228815.1 hypothetical protein [Enterococcus sp. BWB1-3]
MRELLKSVKLQSIDRKLLNELVQTGDFRPFLFDIFFKSDSLFDLSGDCALIFINKNIFYIREEERIDILENVDFPEFTAGSYLLIVSAKDDLTTESGKTEGVLQKFVKRYLKDNAIDYEIQEIPLANNRLFKLCAIYKIEMETI